MRTTSLTLAFLCSAAWLSAQSAPTAEIALDVNGQSDAVVSNGWPLLIRAAVISADGRQVQIALKSGAWTQALHLAITNAGGIVQNWPVQLVPATTPALSLSGITNAEAVWLVAPTSTTSIADGVYNLSVTLDTTATAANGSWAGTATSNAASVQFEVEPTTLSAADTASKYLAIAAYGRFRGDTQGAETALDTLISLQPNALEAYTEKGDLLAAGGNYVGALVLYQQALQKFHATNPNPAEPLTILTVNTLNIAAGMAEQMINLTGKVKVTTSGLVYSHTSHEFSGTMTVTNTGSTVIPSPISIALNSLPTQVTLDNATGTLGLGGIPYIRAINSGSLGSGQSVAVPIRFADPSMGAITFTPVPYSGI
jgi:hypothetical protein